MHGNPPPRPQPGPIAWDGPANDSGDFMKRQITVAAVLAASALALTGCGGSGAPGEDSTTSAAAEEPSFDGRWEADDPEDAFLQFTVVDDGGGTLSGGDGCNGIGGDFFIDGDTARVERGPSTLKGCPGVDTWLGGVNTVVVDGDTMTVQDENGEELGTLTRADEAEATQPGSTGSPSVSIDEATEDADDGDS